MRPLSAFHLQLQLFLVYHIIFAHRISGKSSTEQAGPNETSRVDIAALAPHGGRLFLGRCRIYRRESTNLYLICAAIPTRSGVWGCENTIGGCGPISGRIRLALSV